MVTQLRDLKDLSKIVLLVVVKLFILNEDWLMPKEQVLTNYESDYTKEILTSASFMYYILIHHELKDVENILQGLSFQ